MSPINLTNVEIDISCSKVTIPWLRQQIHQCFAQCGEIEIIRLCFSIDFGYVVIHCKNNNLAEAFLKLEQHDDGNKIRITNARSLPSRQFEHPESLPEHDSNSNLMNALNNDCFLKIFEYFTLDDLCNIADVNKKLNGFAKTLFEKRFKNLQIEESKNGGIQISEESESTEKCVEFFLDTAIVNEFINEFKKFTTNSNDLPTITKTDDGNSLVLAECLFRNFGHLITSIQLSSINLEYFDTILLFIRAYCLDKNGNLENLELDFDNAKNYNRRLLQQILPRIKRLETFRGRIKSEDLSYACQLTELRLLQTELVNTVTHEAFALLESITVDPPISWDSYVFHRLLESTPALKVLHLCSYIFSHEKFFTDISEKENLEALIMDGFSVTSDRDLAELSKLKNLKTIKLYRPINFITYNDDHIVLNVKRLIISLVDNNSLIEHFACDYFLFNFDIIDGVSKLTQLKKLELFRIQYDFSVDELIYLIQGLPNLISLEIGNIYRISRTVPHINQQSYETIVGLIKDRGNNTKLDIEFFNIAFMLSVPNDVIQEHQQWLSIKL